MVDSSLKEKSLSLDLHILTEGVFRDITMTVSAQEFLAHGYKAELKHLACKPRVLIFPVKLSFQIGEHPKRC